MASPMASKYQTYKGDQFSHYVGGLGVSYRFVVLVLNRMTYTS